MSAKFAIASVHCSLDGDLPGKIVRACAKQTDEIAKLIDGCGNVAAKIRAKPAGRVSGECGLAAQNELVALLSNIKLLKLNFAVVNRCADHDRFGCAIVPRGSSQFSPERCSYAVRFSEVSTKGEVGSVKQTVNAIGETKHVRGLRQRNVAGAARNLLIGMLRTPLMLNVAANFPPKNADVELHSDALLTQTPQDSWGGLHVDTAATSK